MTSNGYFTKPCAGGGGANLPVNLTPPVFNAIVAGQNFDVTPGTWDDAVSFTYDVVVDDIAVLYGVSLAVVNATPSVPTDSGQSAYVREHAFNADGEAFADSAVEVIGAGTPQITVPPVLTWSVEVGSSPLVTPPVYIGAAGTLTYTMQRNGVNIGGLVDVSEAVIEAYVATPTDAAATSLQIVPATVTNAFGSDTADSNTVQRALSPPVNTVLPVFGAILAGQNYNITAGTWLNAVSFTYDVVVNGVAVVFGATLAAANATASTAAMNGQNAYVREHAFNADGSAYADSAVVVIGSGAPLITVAPVLTWTVALGSSPAVTPPTYLGAAATITYTMQRNGVDVPGLINVSEATIEAYVAVGADVSATSMQLVPATVTNAYGSATANSNAVAFTPSGFSDLLVWLDITDLAPGTVTSWIDRISGFNTVNQAGTVTRSDTAFSGGYPGNTFPGNANLKCPSGTSLNGKNQLTAVFSVVASITSVMVWLEQSVDAPANNGSWAVFQNSPGTAQLNGRDRIGGGEGARHAPFTGLVPSVVAVGWSISSLTGAAQIVFIRVNGVALTMTNQLNGSTVGTFANQDLYIGARGATATSGLNGSMGTIILRNASTQDNELIGIERYIGRQAGITY